MMRKKSSTRKLVALTAFVIQALLCNLPIRSIASVKGTLPSARFDSNNVVIKFAVIADTHIQGVDGIPSRKLESALRQLEAKAAGKLNALMICGDLTDFGLPEQVTELKRVIDRNGIDLGKTRFIAALGNHEYYNHQLKGAPWNGGYLLRDVFGDEAYNGATDDEIRASDYHTVVDGFDFIAVNCTRYDGGVKYSETDLAWLKAQLAEASRNHPGKPIFVASHPMIIGTNLGSNDGSYWAGTDLYSVLKNYPQVIYFAGHLHYPENDERSIWQGKFTTIGVGSTYYCSNHPTDDGVGNRFIDVADGFETPDAQETSQGLFVEVDGRGDVKITRMDFANDEQIKSPWVIPAPGKDRSQLLYYTPAEERIRHGSSVPVFPSDARVGEIFKSAKGSGEYVLRFTQATDNDMVYSYRISFVDKKTGKEFKTISTLSDFYLHANPKDMASSLTKTIINADSVLSPFRLDSEREYYIRIVALNCFGMKSNPLVSKTFGTANKGNTKVLHLDGSFIQSGLCGNWSDERWQEEFSNLKKLGMHYVIIGPAAESYPGRITRTIYLSSLPNNELATGPNGLPYPDIVDACLRNAESAGMKVFIGIGMSEKWWSLSLKDSTWLYDQMHFDNKVCDELWSRYKHKYPDAFYGWYWTYEVANVDLGPQGEEALTKAMNIQLDHLTSTGERLPLMWCPFMNSKFGTPEAYEKMWKNVFVSLHTNVGDIFCPQDCVGAGGLKLDQVPTWFSALRRAVETKPGLVMWSDVETFDSRDWSSATIGRLVSQMRIEEPYVDNYISFAHSHYDSPYVVAPGFQATYADYLKTGVLESSPPTTPANFNAKVEPNGNVTLKWEPSRDDIGVCGYYVYRNGEVIFRNQIKKEGEGEDNSSILTSLTDVSLLSNINYTYQVRAYDFAGNLSAPSPAITVNPKNITYLPNEVSLGCPYSVSIPAIAASSETKDTKLTDGVYADSATAGDPRWEGFHDTHQEPRDVVIDLGKTMLVQQFVADYLLEPEAEIYLPLRVTVLISTDSLQFRKVADLPNPNVSYNASPSSYKYRYTLSKPVDARYVDFRTVPASRWYDELTFQDEFEVRSGKESK